MSKMREASAEARRKKSQENPNIKSFLYFVEDWKKIHGKIRDWKTISDTLNKRGVKTPTGLPFTFRVETDGSFGILLSFEAPEGKRQICE